MPEHKSITEEVTEILLFICENRTTNITPWERDLLNDRLDAYKMHGRNTVITEDQEKIIKQIYTKVKLTMQEKL